MKQKVAISRHTLQISDRNRTDSCKKIMDVQVLNFAHKFKVAITYLPLPHHEATLHKIWY